MVPPSSADAEHAAALERLRLLLRLGRERVLLLLCPAPPARLRSVVLEMLKLDPALRALDRPTEVWSLAPGSLALIRVSGAELDWLNRSRPVFADRGLRAVLWPADDLPTGFAFRERAPDLYDWITAKIELSPALPPFAVLGLRAAVEHRPGVAWRGGDLAPCLTEAGLGDAPRLSAQDPYDALVETLRGLKAPAVVWTGTDGRLDLWRLRWAVAESGYDGLAVLAAPPRETPGWWPLHGRILDWREGAEALRRAGAADGALLAALLNGEPEAVERAAARIQAGEAESTLIVGCGQAEDAGVWLAAEEPGADPPALRAVPGEARTRLPEEPGGLDRLGSRVEAGLRSATRDTLSLALDAQGIGEHEAALRWAGRALSAAGEDAERAVGALVARWTSLRILGAVDEEQQALAQARERLSRVDPTRWTDPRALGLGAIALAESGDLDGARPLIERASSLTPDDAHPELVPTLRRLSRVQELAGDLTGARASLERAVAAARDPQDRLDPDRAYNLLLLATAHQGVGESAQAKASAEAALDLYLALRGADEATDGLTWWIAACQQIIGAASLDLGDTEGARVASRAAIDALRRLSGRRQDLGDPLAGALHNLGASLRAQGDLQGAQDALDEAVRLYRRLAARWPTLFLASLGRTLTVRAEVLAARGEVQNALAASQEAVAVLRRAPNAGREDLAFAIRDLASLYAGVNDWERALTLTREAIRMLRELAADGTTRYRLALANALHRAGLWSAGRKEQPDYFRDALAIYDEEIAELDVGSLRWVAAEARTIAKSRSQMEMTDLALVAVRVELRALRRLQELTGEHPVWAIERALYQEAHGLAFTGDGEGALRVAEELVREAEQGRGLRPRDKAMQAEIAAWLHLAERQRRAGHAEAARGSRERAGTLLRQWSGDDPELRRFGLARALSWLGTSLDPRDELRPSARDEALRVWRPLYAARPARYHSWYENELAMKALDLKVRKRHSTAVEIGHEWLRIQLHPSTGGLIREAGHVRSVRNAYLSYCRDADIPPDQDLLDQVERALAGTLDPSPGSSTPHGPG